MYIRKVIGLILLHLYVAVCSYMAFTIEARLDSDTRWRWRLSYSLTFSMNLVGETILKSLFHIASFAMIGANIARGASLRLVTFFCDSAILARIKWNES